VSGLAGWIGAGPGDPDALRPMVEAMTRRRPVLELHHDSGFAVGTTRPRLVPSESHLARSANGRLAVAFAGALYSEDLRQRTHPAQHCLDLYQRHGACFPRELNGSFGIAVHDSGEGVLLLVTDRLATRSLYYCVIEGGVVFASEIKAILKYPGISRKLNPERVCEFLAFTEIVGEATYYDHIRQVPSASVLTCKGSTRSLSRYWNLRFDHQDAPDIREHAERAVAVFRRALRRMCTGSRRPALMLSGGLDSRTTAAVAGRRLLCVTMHTVEGYEVAIARRVARTLGYEHRFVALPPDHPRELLQAGALAGDGMHVYHSAQPLALADLAEAEGVDLLLNGYRLEDSFNLTGAPQVSVAAFGRRWALPIPGRLAMEKVPSFYLRYRQTAPAPVLQGLLRGIAWQDLRAIEEARLLELMNLSGQPIDSDDAIELVSGLRNVCNTRDYLNSISIDVFTAGGLPSSEGEMLDLMLATPGPYRFSHRMYSHIYRWLDPGLRRIPYAKTGVPISTNLWWELANRKAHDLGRHAWGQLRRVLDPTYHEMNRTAWPNYGRAMRDFDSFRSILRTYAAESRLADLRIASGDGIRALVESHLQGEPGRESALSAWLTVEEWLRHYG
jgi:hypothetical protein